MHPESLKINKSRIRIWVRDKVSIIVFLFVFLNLFNICPAQEFQTFQGKVNADNINIRSDSSVSSEVICNVNRGDYVEVILEFYDWHKIKLPKTAPAFIKKDLVETTDGKTARVLKDRVNIRLHPDLSSPIIGRVNINDAVNILEDKGQWYKIEPVNSFGWIHKKFVNKVIPVKEDVKIEQKIEEVKVKESRAVDESLSRLEILDETITLEGIIKPYGKVIKRIATHKLITKDGKIFLLKGNREKLNVLTYHKVKVTGKSIDSAKGKYPVIEISKLEVLN